jgi:hypothetical protein
LSSPAGDGLEWTFERVTGKAILLSEQVIEVRLDGARIGELTPAMTERYRPILNAVHGRGCVASCRGILRLDERRGRQVELALPPDPRRPRWR